MRHSIVFTLLFAAACGSSKEEGSLPKCESPVSGERISMRQIGQVSDTAVLATSPPNDLRLFVVERRGTIRIINNEQLLPTPFLDLSADSGGPVTAGGELGLLGLAFHPKYATNGTFFVFYTTGSAPWRDVLARCSVSPDNADFAMRESCVEVLSIPDFAGNHNGGMIEFGKDGYLYVATGDGGDANDPRKNGQALNDNPATGTVALLGKILRLDIDKPASGKEYGIPSDNPFAKGGGLPEIFIIGVRNPWRWTFDRETGDMWIADVGQDAVEEVTVLRPAQQKGANLGWSIFEGNQCFRNDPLCASTDAVVPQETRTHDGDGWASISGGQVYRGTCYPDIVGWYFYGDYVKGAYAKARLREDGQLDVVDLDGAFPANPASIHEDARGELFVTTGSGGIYHIEAGP